MRRETKEGGWKMRKWMEFLPVAGIALLLFGCANVKKDVEALKKDVEELGTKLEKGRPVLATVQTLEKSAEEKLSKEDISELEKKVDDAKASLASIIALEKDIAGVKDSLAVLDKKAKGAVKEDIAGLGKKIEGMEKNLVELKGADKRLDALKAKLAEMKKAKEVAKPRQRPKVKKKVK
jgi:DNA repair exonuclease SbcCD ATPase subunit